MMALQLSRWLERRKPWQVFLLYLAFAELASAVAMTVGWHVYHPPDQDLYSYLALSPILAIVATLPPFVAYYTRRSGRKPPSPRPTAPAPPPPPAPPAI